MSKTHIRVSAKDLAEFISSHKDGVTPRDLMTRFGFKNVVTASNAVGNLRRRGFNIPVKGNRRNVIYSIVGATSESLEKLPAGLGHGNLKSGSMSERVLKFLESSSAGATPEEVSTHLGTPLENTLWVVRGLRRTGRRIDLRDGKLFLMGMGRSLHQVGDRIRLYSFTTWTKKDPMKPQKPIRYAPQKKPPESEAPKSSMYRVVATTSDAKVKDFVKNLVASVSLHGLTGLEMIEVIDGPGTLEIRQKVSN